MRPAVIIAGKEMRDGMRNRWVVATTALMAALALTLAFLGAAPTGTVKASGLAVTIVSLSSLTIFLVPLIALLLSYDAIVGEVDRGTMALLLAYPVARWQVVIGKFAGHLAILGFAIAVGYGVAALALQWAGNDDNAAWTAFGVMELSCEESDVSAVLRGLPGSAEDIEIIRPSLDDLYASFQRRSE